MSQPPYLQWPLFSRSSVAAFDRSLTDTVRYRLATLKKHFGDRLLTDITASDIEDFLHSLEGAAKLHPKHKATRQRQPSTINRWRALLVKMFSFAVEKDHLARSPFNKPGLRTSLVPKYPENDARDRRLVGDEYQRLLDAANGQLKMLIRAAVLTGMRRGEMLKLTFADLEAKPGWIRLRGRTTKTGKARYVPVNPQVQAIFDFQRNDATNEPKPLDTPVFSNEVGEPIKSFETAWRNARTAAGVANLRWHDLRREFGSSVLETGGTIIDAMKLLGHADGEDDPAVSGGR